MAAQSEFRGPGGPYVSDRLGRHPHSAGLLCQVLPRSWPSHLPSGPAPSCPAGSRCPLPPSPPTSEARSPAPQTDSGCPCRSGRKWKPGVRPGWSRSPRHSPCTSSVHGAARSSPPPRCWLRPRRESTQVWDLGSALSWTWREGVVTGSTVGVDCGW